jgi:hypothetical protein
VIVCLLALAVDNLPTEEFLLLFGLEMTTEEKNK